jgi:phospholipid N-methyltransferase
MDKELQDIKARYERRKNAPLVIKYLESFYFSHFIRCERELKYSEIIKQRFEDIGKMKLLEVGAGFGDNLYFFRRLGFNWENIYANELLSDRIDFLKNNFPQVNLIEGDACHINETKKEEYDIIFQSTVFTSILDKDFKLNLANKMWELVKPGGLILWYDFIYNNPKNKDVKGIKKKEIIQLFHHSKNIKFYRVTLAPPIGRRVKKLYSFFNVIPFLRTHIIAEIEK